MSTRPRTTAAPRSRPRRDQLAAIAAELFAQRGFHNVSVNDIAAAAGLSGPAVYRHFRTKQALLGHVLRTALAEATQVVDTAHEPGAETRLRCVCGALAAFVVRQPEFCVLWRRERRHLAPEDAAATTEQFAHVMGRIAAELRRLRPDLAQGHAELLSSAAFSVLGSVSDHRVRLPQAAFEQLLTAIVMDVLTAGMPPCPQRDLQRPPATGLPALDSRREQLLTAAAQQFRDRGYHAVTMEEIGSAAGIAGPSVYAHFSGKSELLLTAANRIRELLRHSTEKALAAGLGERDTLDLLVTSYVGLVLGNRDLVAAYFSEGHNLPERDRSELRRFQRVFAAHWTELTTAVLRNRTENEVRVRVHAAFAVVNDLAQTRRFAERPGIAAQLRDLMLTVLLLRS